MAKNVVVLGATGSIGTQTLDVIAASNGQLRAHGLSAHRQWRELLALADLHRPAKVVLTDESLRANLADEPTLAGVEWGEAGVRSLVTDPAADIVVAAMVGAAGLNAALMALEAGKPIALANKEVLVVGGCLVTAVAQERGLPLLPVDSEHSAIFQCLAAGRPSEVARIILTASGGPFRELPINELKHVTIDQALRHPTWTMGPKITIDSATMMNKALEIIEAHWLFGLPAEKIDVVIHPQSMVHSMVEFVDGSVIAQLSPPDMRLPIQYALTYPERLPSPARKLDLARMGRWDFSTPDPERYPALRLGYDVIRGGGTCGAALNAANEVAVSRFLAGEIRYVDIVRLCQQILEHHDFDPRPSLDGLRRVDRWARQEAKHWKGLISSAARS